jgi:conjugative relaxase-like TrwC/TraI family protein
VLSIASAGAGHQNYYLDLARSDHDLAAGEPPGWWHGSGAEHLGLIGAVSRDAFECLLNGNLPDGSPASQRQDGKTHKAGYDLTFSLPKWVSAVWAVADGVTRRRIEDLADRALDSALDYLEETAVVTRRGHGGLRHERAKLIAARFLHGTSRNLDPHLHVHVFAMNVCVREDGTTGTLHGPALFRAKMAAGSLFRAELAHLLGRELRVPIAREGPSFRVEGVPESLVKAWSSRRHEIEEALARRGVWGAKASAVAALDTRGEKVVLPRAELYERWAGEARHHGFTPEHARNLMHAAPARDAGNDVEVAVRLATARIVHDHGHFSEQDLVRFAAEEAQGRGVGAAGVLAGVKRHLESSPEIVRLGALSGEVRYTTTGILALEESLFSRVEASRRISTHTVSAEGVSQVLSSRPTMTGEQAATLLHVTRAPGGIKVVVGMAGAGKTFLLDAVREAFEREGFSVYGAALAGEAARGLELGGGIPSSTLHSLLARIDQGTFSLGSKTVLILDEAGRIGTRQMEEVVGKVRDAGGLLVCVGGLKQVRHIEHGGTFAAMGRLLGNAELVLIQRQREEWAREAVRDIASGRAGSALRAFAERGLFHVASDRSEAMQEVIRAWRPSGLIAPSDALIFAATDRESSALNRLAQAERRLAGELGAACATIGSDIVHLRDRVTFTRNSRPLGVVHGDLGTVLGRKDGEGILVVRLDTGRVASVPLRDYGHLRLGYALATREGQGATCDRAFVLLEGGTRDLHISCVQASRARHETHLFVDRATAGDEISDLARSMGRDRSRTLAHDAADGTLERTRAA